MHLPMMHEHKKTHFPRIHNVQKMVYIFVLKVQKSDTQQALIIINNNNNLIYDAHSVNDISTRMCVQSPGGQKLAV